MGLEVMETYQVMPPLTDEEYESLKADIAERGVQVPVEYDEDGNILDGHHRVRACEELGIGEWPHVVRRGLTEDQKYEHALKLNIARRQLSPQQRAEKVAELRARGWTQSRIAEATGLTQGRVSQLINTNKLEQPEAIIGADGKARKPSFERETEAPTHEEQPAPAKDEAVFVEAPANMDDSPDDIVPPAPRYDTALRMSESNEWYTPPVYIEAARKVLGEIDLDPASCEAANRTVRAPFYYDKESNGLDKEWSGRVWLNPPYGGLSGPFAERLVEQYEAGMTQSAILLVNANSTDTKWFQPLWDYTLCFTDHRINFISPDGEKNGSTHGSVFVYFGPSPERFAEVFSRFGPIVRRWGL